MLDAATINDISIQRPRHNGAIPPGRDRDTSIFLPHKAYFENTFGEMS